MSPIVQITVVLCLNNEMDLGGWRIVEKEGRRYTDLNVQRTFKKVNF